MIHLTLTLHCKSTTPVTLKFKKSLETFVHFDSIVSLLKGMIRGDLKETIIGWFNSWNTGQQLNSSFWKILNGIESKMAQYFPRAVSCRTLCPRRAFWRESFLGQVSFRNRYILKLSNHVLEKILESPLDSKEIKSVNPKGNQPWIFIGRTEASILWPPDVKSWFIGKDPDAAKDWGQEEKGTTEDEMVGWYHRLNRHDFK